MSTTEPHAESRPPKRRWLQYSLRAILLVMTLTAIGLGIWTDRARKQQYAVAMIQQRGGCAQYGLAKASLPGLAWLRKHVGIDYFDHVAAVQLAGDSLTDADLEQLRALPGLESLDLLCPNVTDAGLANVDFLRNLKDLRLGGPGITDRGLIHLQHLSRLTQLTLEYCAITDTSTEPSTPLKGPSQVSSRGSPVDPRAVARTFATLVSPTEVEFIDTPLSDVCGYLQDLHGIKVRIAADTLGSPATHEDLPITYATQGVTLGTVLHAILRPHGLDWVVAKDGLLVTTKDRAGEFTTTKLTGAGLAYLKGLPQVQVLVLRLPNFTGTGLEHLDGFPQLRELDLRGTLITDATAASLADATQLESLNLSDTSVTDAAVKLLQGLGNLRTLDLHNTRISDTALRHIERLRKLETLNVGNAPISDAGLEHLKGLTHLTELNLCKAQITDAGLEHLKELRRLDRLDLSHTQITDAGLEHLEALTQLQMVWFPWERVTKQGVKKFQKALPKCRVIR